MIDVIIYFSTFGGIALDWYITLLQLNSSGTLMPVGCRLKLKGRAFLLQINWLGIHQKRCLWITFLNQRQTQYNLLPKFRFMSANSNVISLLVILVQRHVWINNKLNRKKKTNKRKWKFKSNLYKILLKLDDSRL